MRLFGRWLGVPLLTPADVIDVVEAADRKGDGNVDYRAYMAFLESGEQKAPSHRRASPLIGRNFVFG